MFEHSKGKKDRHVDSSLLMALRKQRLSATNLWFNNWIWAKKGSRIKNINDWSLISSIILKASLMKVNTMLISILLMFSYQTWPGPGIQVKHIRVLFLNPNSVVGLAVHFHKSLIVYIDTMMYLKFLIIVCGPMLALSLLLKQPHDNCTFVYWINPYHKSNHYRKERPSF